MAEPEARGTNFTEPNWIKPFRFFCSRLTIDSKETGVSSLKFFGSQEQYLAEIAEGWSRGIHSFIILKSRQIGVSTISIALDLFWVLVNPGLQGAIITHDEAAREDFRSKIQRYAASLPEEMKLDTPKSNRYRLEFTNGSVLNLMVAGTKAKGTLGRAFGLNFVHGTECSSWGDEEGLVSLRNSLAEHNPRRLYIFESTARGFNLWNRIWEESVEDPTVKRFFLGWYLRQDQTLAHDDPRWEHYWDGELMPEEIERCEAVKQLYRVEVTPEQVAWYRWKIRNIGDEILAMQEQPWTADEAFIMSGSPFFPIKQLTKAMREEMPTPFNAYRYSLGDDFLATQVEPVNNLNHANLRVWEEPDPEGVYVLGADPAYGINEENDRSCVQVFRCYADRFEQVAEFADSTATTAQMAWIIAHLGGVYKNTLVNLEITGPGMAVWEELRHLRRQFDNGILGVRAKDYSLGDIFGGMRWFFYHRPDSTGAGMALHWKTNYENKRRILNQFKDGFSLKIIRVHSVPLLNEMQSITIKEGSIGGEGSKKDDRVMAAALATVAWTDWIRGGLITQGRTYAEEMKRIEAKQQGKPYVSMERAIVADFFKRKEQERADPLDMRKYRA